MTVSGRSIDAQAVLPPEDRAILAHLHRVWSGLRDGPQLPQRAKITPQALGIAMDHAILVEQVPRVLVRVRLAGCKLTDHLGIALQGKALSTLVRAGDRGRLARTIDHALSLPATLEAPLLSGIAPARLMVLPLAGGRLALGAIVGAGINTFPPEGLALGPVVVTALPGLPAAGAHLRLVGD